VSEATKLKYLKIFLFSYGCMSFLIFIPLTIGFILKAPILDTGGLLNWLIWNGVICGAQPCYVPLMLFSIYFVWAVYFFRASRDPLSYLSFLDFTAWANLAHGLLMAVQTSQDFANYWSKWLTDIPFILGISIGIFLLRPKSATESSQILGG
jgi:hypothetical protein